MSVMTFCTDTRSRAALFTPCRRTADERAVAAGCRDGLWRVSGPGSGRRREELQRNPVWVAEGDARAVMGVHDSAMHNAQLVQAGGPALQLTTVTAREGNMI